MTKLSVNLNKVALLRNARTLDIPSVTDAARTCIAAGAHGITVHPRPDQRHIRFSDVHALAALLADVPTVEYNIEGNPFEGQYMDLVRLVRPTQCTLVPDDPDARTSDHGWDVAAHTPRLRPIVAELQAAGMRVSLFMDPDLIQIDHAAHLGVDRIELYTEPYARAFAQSTFDAILDTYARAAEHAQTLGLGINAGHDLNQKNLPTFCSTVPNLLEVSIGHALIADALHQGLFATVEAYLSCIS